MPLKGASGPPLLLLSLSTRPPPPRCQELGVCRPHVLLQEVLPRCGSARAMHGPCGRNRCNCEPKSAFPLSGPGQAPVPAVRSWPPLPAGRLRLAGLSAGLGSARHRGAGLVSTDSPPLLCVGWALASGRFFLSCRQDGCSYPVPHEAWAHSARKPAQQAEPLRRGLPSLASRTEPWLQGGLARV